MTKSKILKYASCSLFIFALLFGFTFKNSFCLGDNILTSLGIAPWSGISGGTHYTGIIAFLMITLSFLLYSWSVKKDKRQLKSSFYTSGALMLFFLYIFMF